MGDLLANGPAARSCLTTLARLSHWRQPAGAAAEGALPLAAWAAAAQSTDDDTWCVVWVVMCCGDSIQRALAVSAVHHRRSRMRSLHCMLEGSSQAHVCTLRNRVLCAAAGS